MDAICGTPFWNSSVSWETDIPNLSPCFQHLVLVIGSCAVLWIVAPFEFVKICRAPINPLPWTPLSISKLALKVLLLLICSLDLSTAVYSYVNNPNGLDKIIATVSYFVTIVLTVILTVLCKNRGIHSSFALPSFWMISTMTTLLSIYNDILLIHKENTTQIIFLTNDCLTFVLSLIQLIMSTMISNPTEFQNSEMKDYCPLENCTLPSRLTLNWMMSLLKRSEHSLHQDHLIPLCSEQKSEFVIKEFQKLCHTRHASNENECNFSEIGNESENFIYPEGKSLFLMLIKISRKFIIIASFLEILYIALYYLPVYMISLILDQDKKEEKWHNYVYSVGLFLILLFASFANSQRKYFGLTGALKIKSTIINAIFTKSLMKVPQDSEFVKKLVTVDSENLFQAMCIMSDVWGSPIRLILGIYILWSFIGASCFVGVLTGFFLIPANIIVEYCISRFQKGAENKKVEFIELLSECLHGIKALKLYAWEEFFLEKLRMFRKAEIGQLRKAFVLRMIFKFLYLSSIPLVTVVTFTTYVFMENTVDVKTLFLSFFIIYLLKSPFQSLVHLLAYFIEGVTAMKKIQNFLETQEPSCTVHKSENNSLTLTNASFSWNGYDEACLKNLNLRIPQGSLIAVIGETGSGKSSLLRATLGEMQKIAGEISTKGQIAFVDQNSWIQNTTLEKNILFLRNKDPIFYQKTLEACALNVDLESLPAGEETEIGQKGINLTLAQKLKVDLARAVYQNADFYILDDPLKHLDTLLSEHLYHRVIGRSGILKEKTRIFMTKSVNFLPLADSIVFLKDGRIVEQGTYSELKEKNGYFSEYLKTYPSESVKNLRPTGVPETYKRKCDSYGKQNDLWCSAVITPVKLDMEYSFTNDTTIISKGLGTKLADYLKIIGFFLTATIILIAGLACFCEVTIGIWISNWVDEHLKGYSDKHNLLLLACIILSQVFLTITCGIAIFVSSTLAATKLHTWLLSRIMRAAQMVFETTPVQKIIDSFDKDFRFIDERIPDTFYVWLFTVLKVPGFLVIIFIATPFLAVALIPLTYLFLVVQRLYLASWQQLQHLTIATSCPLSNLIEDTLRGISHIRAAAATPHFLHRFHSKLDTHNNCSFLFLAVSRWLSCVMDFTMALLVLVISIVAFYQQNQGNGLIVLAIIYAIQLGDTLTAIIYSSSLLNADLIPLESIISFSQMKQESEWEDPSNRPPSSWPHLGSLIVHNVTTGIGDAMHPVIHNINLSIKPGEKVAIVGKEESGIYTFLYSLFRLIEPLEGNIIIDNIDILKIGLRDLRSKLAIIPQDTVIFKGSLRHNLDPGEMYTDNELKMALKDANYNSSISFSNLDSTVDQQISSEEKSVLSIARCLLKKPKLVIIDEPSDSKGRVTFQDSTILTFSEQPIIDHNGRTIKFMSGEIVSEDFLGTSK